MKKKANAITIQNQAGAPFKDVQRATSLVFYLRDHMHITKGKELLSELMQYVDREGLTLPVEYCAALCMSVAGEYRMAQQSVAA